MYKNYIFDLYGTLVDIHTDEEKPEFWKKMAWYFSMKGAKYAPEELRARYGVLIAGQQRYLPQGAEVNLGQVFTALYMEKAGKNHLPVSRQEIADTASIFRCLSMEKLQLFDGAAEMLEGLKKAGKRVYLLSNAQALFTMPELRMLGLESYFDGILLSSDAGFKKPARQFYGLLKERYGVLPEESVMVGNDDEADCHGAASAGMDSLYICTEQSPKRTKPLPENCREIGSIREVLNTIHSVS